MTSTMGSGARFAWGLVLLVGILHFDFWLWDSTTLLFGFMPVGLAYQAGISLAAALAWTLVIRFAWPDEVEVWAAQGEQGPGERR